jgi:SAM-dependent methyltransferase
VSEPERTDLAAIYARRFPDSNEAHAAWRRALWHELVRSFFSRWIPPDGVVLDFGSGRGEFINAVEAGRRIAADVRGSRETLDSEVEFHPVAGVRVPDLADHSVDVVFCSNLLEHLPDRATVLELLDEFRRLLAPSGRLLVLGPNLRFTGPAYWDFFDHVLPFTHASLAEALAAGGFTTELLIPRFLPYTTVGARRTPMPLVRLYLRLPLLWRWLGAQFFAVARPDGSHELESSA